MHAFGAKNSAKQGVVEMEAQSEGWKKRIAVQLTAQLPEGREDAMAVIEYMRELVTGFLCTDHESYPQQDRVNQRPALAVLTSSTAPSLRANSNGSPSGFPK